MKYGRIIAFLVCLSLCLQMVFLNGCSKKEVKIYDREGNVLVGLQTSDLEKVSLEDEGYRSYIEIVVEEVIQLIQEEKECDEEEAKNILFDEECYIYTSFEQNIYDALKQTYDEEFGTGEMSFGCAVTDTNGKLLATYSVGSNEGDYFNYATSKTPPYSTFKPLSVYAPCIEKGVISWSKMYEDSPVKQVEEADGTMRDWPANATNEYSYENICVCDAIKQSLNTVAVKCIQEYGVADSMRYLKDNYRITMAFEETRLYEAGEEEILGNIALGYLYAGVSPVDMAGYYQTFVTGGKYVEPKTITKICNKEGKILWEVNVTEKQVMSEETAFIMNQLLQGVVSQGGTGEEAQCDGLSIGGKTGTGSEGNWFVGFTPEYTCAVWHGTEIIGNKASEVFATAVSQFKHNKDAIYPECDTVKIRAYCLESGMLYSERCLKMGKGYYLSSDETERCNIHE